MAIIVQSYCILLSVLFSINRQQLSIFDANHALIFVSSPLMMDVVIICIKGLLGVQFKRVKSHPRAIYTLGVLLLPLWFGLSLTLRFSSRAFIDSELCSNTTYEDWSKLLSFDPADSDFFVKSALSGVAVFCLGRSIQKFTQQVMSSFRAQEGKSEPQGRLRTPWTSVKCAWYIPVVLGI